MPPQRTTGPSPEQFITLCELIEDSVGDRHPITGRRRAPSLNTAVKATVRYPKNNLTQEVIAELLEVGQPTISRVLTELEVLIADVLDAFVPDPAGEVAGRVAIVDGSLCVLVLGRCARAVLRQGHHNRACSPVCLTSPVA